MLIYSSKNVKQVVAECDIELVDETDVDALWEKTKDKSGISEEYYRQYFKGAKKCYAIRMSNIHFFDKPRQLTDYKENGKAPQSFCYVTIK